MKKRLLCSFIASVVALVAAERADIELNDGRVLRGARVLVIGETQAQISHEGGIQSVPIDAVPLDILARAAMRLESEAKGEDTDLGELKLELRRSDREKLAQSKSERSAEVRAAVSDLTIHAAIKIIQITSEGVLASGTGFQGRPVAYPVTRRELVRGTGLDAHKKVWRERTEYTYARKSAGLPERFFVEMRTVGLTDGQVLGLRIWPMGTYSYLTVLGSRSTVRRYTTDLSRYLASIGAARAADVFSSDER